MMVQAVGAIWPLQPIPSDKSSVYTALERDCRAQESVSLPTVLGFFRSPLLCRRRVKYMHSHAGLPWGGC